MAQEIFYIDFPDNHSITGNYGITFFKRFSAIKTNFIAFN